VRIISAQNSDDKWQAYTMTHEVITVRLDELARRISQSGQCICTYTKVEDVCRCTAKFEINSEDRALAMVEVTRRRQVIKRLRPLHEHDTLPDCIAELEAEEQQATTRAEKRARGH